MKKKEFVVIQNGIKDTSEAKRGKDIFYRCEKCSDIVPSIPKDNINCKCGNIGIDKDMNRLFVEDYVKFTIVKAVESAK